MTVVLVGFLHNDPLWTVFGAPGCFRSPPAVVLLVCTFCEDGLDVKSPLKSSSSAHLNGFSGRQTDVRTP